MKKKHLFYNFFVITSILISTSGYAQTVTIGNQVWTSTNLNVSTYRNGDIIPQVHDRNAWANLTTGAWCYYYNESYNGSKYGKLYNWYAVNDPRGLAPNGYHIPTNAEWTTLIDYLGGEDVAGTKMKSVKGWQSTTSGGSKTCSNCSTWNAEYRKKVPCHTCKDTRSVSTPTVTNSGNGSNSSGFSGLPGGMRFDNGAFLFSGDSGKWWSSSERGTSSAWSCDLGYDVRSTSQDYTNDRRYGLSVRCLKD